MLRLLGPAAEGGPVTADQVLDAVSNHIKSGLGGRPLLRAGLLHALGDTYLTTASPLGTMRVLEDARRILVASAIEDGALNEGIELSMARVHIRELRYQQAEALLLHVIEGRSRRLGEEHPDTLRAMSLLGLVYRWMNRPEKALPQLKIAARGLSRTLGPGHPETMEAHSRT